MGNVYSNAIVNIAATHAIDGSFGLFAEREVSRIPRHFIQTDTSSTYEIVDNNLHNRCMKGTPLSNRAWTFQERYLALRTLHFTAEQIFFECRKHIVCESYPDGMPAEIEKTSFPRTISVPTSWAMVVHHYSRAQLTYSKDKLIALSGVARQFHERTRDEYLAGMWRTNLEEQLCWTVDAPQPSKSHPDIYRAPSWSWASIDGPFDWGKHCKSMDGNTDIPTANASDPDPRYLIQVLEVNMTPLDSDVFGQIQDATLKLRCYTSIHHLLVNDFAHDPNIISLKSTVDPADKSGEHLHYSLAYYDRKSKPAGTGLDEYLLPIFEKKCHLGNYSGMIQAVGLVIAPASDRRKGCFIRLGVWMIYYRAQSFDALMEALSYQPQNTMDDALYKEILEPDANGLRQYAITLV
jgi:hypothetical protein